MKEPPRFAIICASNQNRSMEAHHALNKKGFTVSSFGTNSLVKLPGPSQDRPNSYAFGTPYEQILQDLKAKDATLYTQNGLLSLMERNKKIKPAPQRFQEAKEMFDVIVTCEERCFGIVCEEIQERGIKYNRPVHIVNFDITDNQEEAMIGARSILSLAQQIANADSIDGAMESIIREVQERGGLQMLYAVQFY